MYVKKIFPKFLMKIQSKEGISVNYCHFLEKAYRCADTCYQCTSFIFGCFFLASADSDLKSVCKFSTNFLATFLSLLVVAILHNYLSFISFLNSNLNTTLRVHDNYERWNRQQVISGHESHRLFRMK